MSNASIKLLTSARVSAAAALGLVAFGILASGGVAKAGQYGPDECQQGYVWRDSRPGDHVCVTPRERAVARFENNVAETRVQAGGGAYGPATCQNGYVWREAFAGDTVCVPPSERRRAKMNNAEADGRFKF
jgi:hypothetical protein